MATTSLPFGVVNAPGQRYHPAIIAQAAATICEMFPRRLWIALGHRRGLQRAHHRRALAGQGDAQRPAARVRRRHARAVRGRGGHAPRARARRPRPAVDAARRAAAARRRGGERADRALAGRTGRTGWRRSTRRARPWSASSAAGATPEARAGSSSRCTSAGRRPTRRRCAIAHDQWRTNVFSPPICWDLDTRRGVRRGGAPRPTRGRARLGARDQRSRRSTSAWLHELLALEPDELDVHHVGQEQGPFIDAFGEHVLPELADEDQGDQRPVVEERGPLLPRREMFLDADGDGCGDLQGLTERVDYLAGIGVSCLWLMPFHPSPNRDDGYDISDFYGVDPELGTLGDFAEMLRTARDRGHPRDRRLRDEPHLRPAPVVPGRARRPRLARTATSTSGCDEKPEEKPGDIVFPDQESSNWAWDDEAGQYYLHRFYSYQPDLNLANPQVRDEIAQVIGFWLEQGLSGFRVDAVPFMLEPMGLPEGALQDPHELLRDLRALPVPARGRGDPHGRGQPRPRAAARVLRRRGRRRAAHGPELHRSTRRCTSRSRASGRRRSPTPCARSRRSPRTRSGPTSCATTTSSRWTSSARRSAPRSSRAFGPEERHQLYGRGLRRRLPTMLDGDPRRASVSPTRSRSRCRARRSSSTARRSGWPRTSTSRAA